MTTANFGTVASEYAKSNFAPCLIIPPYSCTIPGRKPGTSINVKIGILKQSHVRINLAAFTDASISRQPANTDG